MSEWQKSQLKKEADQKFNLNRSKPKGDLLRQKVLDKLTTRGPTPRDSETDDEVVEIKKEKTVMKRKLRDR